ncbi:MAG TPA: hypothetical protein VJZ26_15955 [Blastocatellia bacterium]|nr:hypothetical protein [Blastocatellia bacterium]
MRFTICVLVGLLVMATGQITFDLRAGAQTVKASTQIQADAAPKVMDARLKGKKLILTGENFDPGAVILINGEPQKTKTDSDNPGTRLIAKKAGKNIPGDAVVSIQVLNAAGASSAAFGFFSGRTVTIDDGGKTIELTVGERILLVLKNDNLEWAAEVQDSTILKKLTDVDIIAGAQGIFEAQRAGQTKLVAQGDPPCIKLKPRCLQPSVLFEFNIVVR